MIVYLDTSSLVKLYVEEDASSQVDELVGSCDITATSVVAYAEARAAFARRYREKAYTKAEHARIKTYFDKDWNSYLVMSITGELVRMAGDLAEKHALRGFDAVHLASALILQRELSASIVFSCFDENLHKASEREKLDQR